MINSSQRIGTQLHLLVLQGYLNFRAASGKALIFFPRIEILTTGFGPSNGGEHRDVRGKFLEKNMTFWRPSCFLV